MMYQKSSSLRSQDVLILLKLVTYCDKSIRQIDLAKQLGISQPEITNALERLRRSGLIDESKKTVQRLATVEFLIHAVKFFFPANIGTSARGIATGGSSKWMAKQLMQNDEMSFVWPDEDGDMRGQAVSPIYPSVSFAAKQDEKLYELLALLDSIRIGRARERKLAENTLSKLVLRKCSK